MFNSILKKISQLSKAALAAAIQNSGIAALYLGTSTLLAGLLLAAYLTHAWDIDRDKWYRALAILQGHELDEIQKAERERAAEASYWSTVEYRAGRDRDAEFDRDVRQQISSFALPPEEPKPEPPPPEPSDAEKISAYEKRVAADIAKARTAGREELTRLIEDRGMDLEQAKEVIRKFWKDGFKDLVLTTLLDMTDKRRGDILYTFDQDNPEELNDLNEILKDISDGKPMVSIIENASK